MYDPLDWLVDFIEFVDKKWAKRQISQIKINGQELPKVNKSANSCEASEKFIIDRIESIRVRGSRPYVASRNSETQLPAGVWGLADYDTLIHLMLINVQSSNCKKIPESLNSSRKRELKKFSDFTFVRFHEFAKHTRLFTSRSLILTYGYTGVIINENNSQALSLFEPCYFDCIHSNDWQYAISDELQDFIQFHKLED